MSNSPAVTVLVSLSYWDAYRSSVSLTSRLLRKVLWIFAIIGVCWLILLALAYVHPRPDADWQEIIHNSNPLLWAFGVPILFVYVLPLLSARRIVRDERLKRGVRYELSDSGIRVETYVSTSDWQWAAIRQVIEARHAFLLFTAPYLANTLPLRCFAQQADITRVRKLFQAHVPGTKLRETSA